MCIRDSAIIAEVRPATAHNNRAWERFTADGPLALLPIGQDYAVVFTVPSKKAERLLGLNDEEFLAALRAQFGSRLDFVSTGARASYPLALRIRSRITLQRQVWIGNCAQTLHPVSGQGFNLGSVSYTHLDVYKRQSSRCSASSPASATATARTAT